MTSLLFIMAPYYKVLCHGYTVPSVNNIGVLVYRYIQQACQTQLCRVKLHRVDEP